MRIDDDTPVPGRIPEIYPKQPPVNLPIGQDLLNPRNFFTFEGIDGAGKSELIFHLSQICHDRGGQTRLLKLGRSDVTSHALERAKWLNANPMTLSLLNWVSIYEQISEIKS